MKPRHISVKALLRPLMSALHDRRGATAVEYGLIVGLIVITMMAGFVEVGNITSSMWNNTSAKVAAAH